MLQYVFILGSVNINCVASAKVASKIIPFIWSCISVLAPKING